MHSPGVAQKGVPQIEGYPFRVPQIDASANMGYPRINTPEHVEQLVSRYGECNQWLDVHPVHIPHCTCIGLAILVQDWMQLNLEGVD